MSYQATVIPVMIASPGDVSEERNLIRDVLHELNDIRSVQSNAVLLPVGWETHSSPDLGGRAQEQINVKVLDKCDLLVGVFWTRIGTPTGQAESGTAEEIRKHVQAGKPAMVYFSTAPVAPDMLDVDQYKALQAFKGWCENQGLIEQYDNLSSFSEKFRRHIQIVLRDNEYLKQILNQEQPISNPVTKAFDENLASVGFWGTSAHQLSEQAIELLREATKDKSGTIISMRYLSGQAIQTNSINFTDSADRRSVARWEAALQQLVDFEFVADIGYKGEIFEVTDKGYTFADSLQ